MAALRKFLADPTPHVLWDLRECGVAYHAHGRLSSLVSQLIRADDSKRPSGRSAFVCSCDVDFNAMRNFIAYAEASEYGIECSPPSWISGRRDAGSVVSRRQTHRRRRRGHTRVCLLVALVHEPGPRPSAIREKPGACTG